MLVWSRISSSERRLVSDWIMSFILLIFVGMFSSSFILLIGLLVGMFSSSVYEVIEL